MKTHFFERVNGRIIAPVVVSGGLYYNGKREGGAIDAPTEKDVISACAARKSELMQSVVHEVRDLIYGGEWTIRIYN